MHPLIKKELDEIREYVKFIRSYEQIVHVADEIRERFSDQLPKKSHSDESIQISLGWENGQIKGLIINTEPIETKDLMPLLEYLVDEYGFNLKDKVDEPDFQRRRWNFSKKNGDGFLYITLQAFFWDESKTKCKFVEVGKKEEPVFELQCVDNGGVL